MRIDPTDTSIHDLTPKEARELRALCQTMLSGATDLTHPLFVQWAHAARERESAWTTPAALLTVAFLPRALYALLLRAERGAMKHAKARIMGES
jgi:hypothetical protein